MLQNILLVNLTKPTASSVKYDTVFQVIYKIIVKQQTTETTMKMTRQPGSMEIINNLCDI